MANVLNRNTREYLVSVNTPDYPETEWIINPDLSQVESVPQIYWKVSGDTVISMTPSEIAAVDAEREAAAKAPPANPVPGERWFNQDANNLFAFDAVRGHWLSVNKQTVIFSREGKLTEGSLGIGTIFTLDSGFLNPRRQIVVGVSAAISTGDQSKTFEIIQDDTTIGSFQLVNGSYFADDLNLDLAAGSTLRCHAIGKTQIRDPVVHFELAFISNA